MLPTVPMMLGAPAVPAVSPYVAAASTNASQHIKDLYLKKIMTWSL
ncbi:hypothetical protein cypCar_00002746 [Cyprinus carpio]|nr:hypothetical protein cypCar_00002746 [Cyprinus carpio]